MPVTVSAGTELNLTAYGVLAGDKELFVTLINKEHGPGARDAVVSLAAGDRYANGQVIALTAPDGAVAATNGVTLGGAEIGEDAGWQGRWIDLSPPRNGQFTLKLPAANAVVVRLNTK